MTTHNTMSKTSYALFHIVIGMHGGYLYFKFCLPRFLEQLSGKIFGWNLSVILPVACAGLILAGMAVTLRTRRNSESLLDNLVTPAGVICAIIVSDTYPIAVKIIFTLAAGLVVVIFTRSMIRKFPDGESALRVIGRRTIGIVLKSRQPASFASIACIVLLGVALVSGEEINSPAYVRPDHHVIATDNSLIKTNYETLKKIDEPYWSELTDAEKLNVLQCVVNTEVTYFGLPDAISIACAEMPPRYLGTYSHHERLIQISPEHLKSPARDCMVTVLHEVYHSYQNFQCDAFEEIDAKYRGLLLFSAIPVYAKEFSDYQLEGEAYYSQAAEISARAYSKANVDEYFEKIAKLQNDH